MWICRELALLEPEARRKEHERIVKKLETQVNARKQKLETQVNARKQKLAADEEQLKKKYWTEVSRCLH